MRGAIAGAIVVLGAAVVAWWLWSGASAPAHEDAGGTASRQIKEVAPRATNVVKAVNAVAHTETREERRRRILEEHGWTNGVYYSKHDPEYAGKYKRFIERQKLERPFEFYSENDISVLVCSAPGGFIFPIDFDAKFVEDFKKSLERPIIIEESDSEELKEMKRAVREAKVYLKQQMDDGQDICKILEDSRKEMNKISEMHDDFRRGMYDLYKKGASEQDIDDYITAANTLLDQRGGPRLYLPKKFKARFATNKKRK